MTAATLSSKAIKRIVKELQHLQTSPPEDIQIIVDDENLTEVQAWIRGPGMIKDNRQRHGTRLIFVGNQMERHMKEAISK